VSAIELVEAPLDENGRMISQSGLFTRTPRGEDIAAFIDEYVDLQGNSPILYRIELPDSQRDVFLRHLELMKIHSGTLFPDLAGAAGLANRLLEEKATQLLMSQTPAFLRRMLSDMPVHEGTAASARYLSLLMKPAVKKPKALVRRKRKARR
jgi:hypothetical protein